jgi:hypothetical protein
MALSKLILFDSSLKREESILIHRKAGAPFFIGILPLSTCLNVSKRIPVLVQNSFLEALLQILE